MRYAVLIFLVFATTILFSPFFAMAQSSESQASFTLPNSVDELMQKLPSPVTDFVRSLSRLNVPSGFSASPQIPAYGIPYPFPSIPHDANPGSLLNFVKQLILFVGGFFVVILRVIASIIERVISFLAGVFSR